MAVSLGFALIMAMSAASKALSINRFNVSDNKIQVGVFYAR